MLSIAVPPARVEFGKGKDRSPESISTSRRVENPLPEQRIVNTMRGQPVITPQARRGQAWLIDALLIWNAARTLARQSPASVRARRVVAYFTLL